VSRTRFALLLVPLALVVAAGSFTVGLQLLDDDGADAPPSPPADGTDDGSTTSTTTVPAAALPTPAWLVVIASERDQARATEVAQQVAADGHEVGVLRSDEYPSMNPGYWVAYAGPYPDAPAAQAGEAAVEADGWTAAYVRCAGPVDQCRGAAGDEDDDD